MPGVPGGLCPVDCAQWTPGGPPVAILREAFLRILKEASLRILKEASLKILKEASLRRGFLPSEMQRDMKNYKKIQDREVPS